MISDNVVEMTAQSKTREGSQIAKTMDYKHDFREIVFLNEPVQDCCSRISAAVEISRHQAAASNRC